MPKLLSISRAARLAGVSRAEIQQRVREKDAKVFEGKISMEVLQELYPHLELEADLILDRINRIKAEAKPKSRYSDGWLPDRETLLSRLKGFHHALVHARSALNASEVLINDALDELTRSTNASEPQLRNSVTESVGLLKKPCKVYRERAAPLQLRSPRSHCTPRLLPVCASYPAVTNSDSKAMTRFWKPV